jgi:hypothetical protein
VAIAITCRDCGFVYALKGDGVEFPGRVCPQCHAYAAMVEVDIDLPGEPMPEADYGWFVVDRIGTPISGPFGGKGDGYRWVMRHGLRTDDYPRDSLSVSYLPFPRWALATAAASGRGSTRRSPRKAVRPEPIPALIDALDVTLALWIAQASLSDEAA